MSGLTLNSRGRTPRRRRLPRVGFTVLAFVCPVVAAAVEDPYLELLDKEVTKVDSVSTDTTEDTGGGPSGVRSDGGSRPVPSREQFESLLRRDHVGTYSFYRRLPERSREEIFVDYGNGASMEALRGKIVDRYLHP